MSEIPSKRKCRSRRGECTFQQWQCGLQRRVDRRWQPISRNQGATSRLPPNETSPTSRRASRRSSECSRQRVAPSTPRGRGRCCSRHEHPTRWRRGHRRTRRSSPWFPTHQSPSPNPYRLQRTSRSADQEVGRQAGRTEFLHGGLRGLGLLLTTAYSSTAHLPHNANHRNQTHVTQDGV